MIPHCLATLGPACQAMQADLVLSFLAEAEPLLALARAWEEEAPRPTSASCRPANNGGLPPEEDPGFPGLAAAGLLAPLPGPRPGPNPGPCPGPNPVRVQGLTSVRVQGPTRSKTRSASRAQPCPRPGPSPGPSPPATPGPVITCRRQEEFRGRCFRNALSMSVTTCLNSSSFSIGTARSLSMILCITEHVALYASVDFNNALSSRW